MIVTDAGIKLFTLLITFRKKYWEGIYFPLKSAKNDQQKNMISKEGHNNCKHFGLLWRKTVFKKDGHINDGTMV